LTATPGIVHHTHPGENGPPSGVHPTAPSAPDGAGYAPVVQSSYSPLPWSVLVSLSTCGSLTPSAPGALRTRFPPVSSKEESLRRWVLPGRVCFSLCWLQPESPRRLRRHPPLARAGCRGGCCRKGAAYQMVRRISAGRQPTPTARGPQRSRGATADRRQAGGRETTGEDGPSSKRRGEGKGPFPFKPRNCRPAASANAPPQGAGGRARSAIPPGPLRRGGRAVLLFPPFPDIISSSNVNRQTHRYSRNKRKGGVCG